MFESFLKPLIQVEKHKFLSCRKRFCIILVFKGGAKYDAWSEKEGMGKEEAMQAYIDLIERLKAKE